MKTILEINNVCKEYNNKLVCDNINFKVTEGEFLAIVGESGSGKSTLLKICTSLETKTSGNVIFDNNDLTLLKERELREIRRNIQLVFQDTTEALNPKMKIRNIIAEPLLNFKLISKKDIDSVATKFLLSVGLDETFLNKYPNQMSGGQRQRVNIARALTLNPKILFLDEPTSALDVVTQDKILKLLKELQSQNNLTIVFVCHDIALVANVSDRIVVMKDAKVVEIINTNELSISNLDDYTKELFTASFDIKKCECKFTDDCMH